LAWIGTTLDQIQVAMTNEDYDDMIYKEHNLTEYTGRSKTTGY